MSPLDAAQLKEFPSREEVYLAVVVVHPRPLFFVVVIHVLSLYMVCRTFLPCIRNDDVRRSLGVGDIKNKMKDHRL